MCEKQKNMEQMQNLSLTACLLCLQFSRHSQSEVGGCSGAGIRNRQISTLGQGSGLSDLAFRFFYCFFFLARHYLNFLVSPTQQMLSSIQIATGKKDPNKRTELSKLICSWDTLKRCDKDVQNLQFVQGKSVMQHESGLPSLGHIQNFRKQK